MGYYSQANIDLLNASAWREMVEARDFVGEFQRMYVLKNPWRFD